MAPRMQPTNPPKQSAAKPTELLPKNGQPAPRPTLSSEALERTVEYVPFLAKDSIKLSVALVLQFLCKPTKSGKVCTDADAMRFVMLCKARGLNPWEGDAYLVGFDGQNGPEFNLITAHQAFLKRAEVNPKFVGMESGVMIKRPVPDQPERYELFELEGDFVDPDGDILVGGWAKVHREDRRMPIYRRIRLSTYDKGYSRWKVDPAGMIVKCFDEETEVLTTNGFERFADATGRVLQVTDQGLEPTDAMPFVQRYDGQMVTLDSDDLNFCVTPNHDMVTTAGRIEAGAMYERARSRPQFWIPRCLRSSRPEFGMSDTAIALAAAYLADGQDKRYGSFWIGVSRRHKVEFLEAIGAHHSRHVGSAAGTQAIARGRVITTKADKQLFGYPYHLIAPLVTRDKQVNIPTLLALSQRQARIFVETLIKFDGTIVRETGVRRFYSSNPNIVKAYEIATIIAGFAVSPRRSRDSDISTKPNIAMSISERSEMPVRRWGRAYNNLAGNRGSDRRLVGLEMVKNPTARVWCVTVPSGVIVVRRAGFSMLCGNCAESDALRSAFPNTLGGMYLEDELPGIVELAKTETVALQPGRFVLPPKSSTTSAPTSQAPTPQQAEPEPEPPAEDRAEPEAPVEPPQEVPPANVPPSSEQPRRTAKGKQQRPELAALRHLLEERKINDPKLEAVMVELGMLGDQEDMNLDKLSEDQCRQLVDELAKVPAAEGGAGLFAGGGKPEAQSERR